MTTKKYIIKEQYKKYMTNKNLITFNIHGCKAHELYSLIVILCNRINKEKPYRAYKTAYEILRLLPCEPSHKTKPKYNNGGAVAVQEESETDEHKNRCHPMTAEGES